MTKQHHVIIGANGGIGSVLCRQLSTRGNRLTMLGRNEEQLQRLATELDCSFEIVDATSVEQLENCLNRVSEVQAITGVVNCVGSLLLKPAHLTTPAEWASTISTNLTSAFAATRASFKAMRQSGGAIVLMSSAAARTGLPNHEAIAAAKAGVIGLAQSAAASYASRNIRVNVVAPGLVKTPMTKGIWSNEKAANASVKLHALGRLGEPADIASLIAWLLGEDAAWITGQVFGIDGGLATVRPTVR